MERVVMTREGFDKLHEELNFLKSKKRKEVADQLAEARAHGDLRENAEYDAAKQAKSQLEARISMLEHRLASANIVDPSTLPKDKAYMGATLKLKNTASGDELTYKLVSEDEADIMKGHISITSPIGRALLGKALNETVEVQVPAGKVSFQVLAIDY